MGVNSLLKTVTRQRRDCDLNPGRSAPESSTLTTRLPSHLSASAGYFQHEFHSVARLHENAPRRLTVRSAANRRLNGVTGNALDDADHVRSLTSLSHLSNR